MEYEKKSLVELKALAKERGLKRTSTMKKQELIDTLIEADKGAKGSTATVSGAETEGKTSKKGAGRKSAAAGSAAGTSKKDGVKKETIKKVSAKKDGAKKDDDKKAVVEKADGRKNPIKKEEVKSDAVKKDNVINEAAEKPAETVKGGEVTVERVMTPVARQNMRLKNVDRMAHGALEQRANASGKGVVKQGYNREQNVSRDSSSVRETPTDYKGRNIQKTDKFAANTEDISQLDSGEVKSGILEVMGDGYGFIRCDNFLPGEQDVYVSPAFIRRFGLRTGDVIVGNTKVKATNEKFSALLYMKSVNGYPVGVLAKRKKFEDLTPVFPNERIHLETAGAGTAMRMVDLISPIGKGQRGMIVSQPKAGKTTLLKQVARAVTMNHPEMHLIILLIDERPEEVTDMKESIEGDNVEVIYSTFDELPENHKRVSEMVIERAKRLVEHGRDVMILLDSITRLARAYNLTVQPSGRTLSGGLDPAALHMPKRFFGAARNMREGGSLTILATALVETGSRMDDVVFEEFKGTGNMELVLDRSLSEKRIFPAIDLPKSSTRRDDLLLSQPEMEASLLMRRALNSSKTDEAVEQIIRMFMRTKNNNEFIEMIKKVKII